MNPYQENTQYGQFTQAGGQSLPQYVPPPGTYPHSRGQEPVVVELHFRCLNLSKNNKDPYVRVECQEYGNVRIVGKTETRSGEQNPTFQTAVSIDFNYQTTQELNFVVMDENLAFDSDMGSAKVSLTRLVNGNFPMMLPLTLDQNVVGQIEVRAQRSVKQSRQSIVFTVYGQDIKDINTFSPTNPFIRILKCTGNENPGLDPLHYAEENWTQAYQSEPHMYDLKPKFQEFAVNTDQLCRSQPGLPLKWQIWDYSSRGKHQLIGEGCTTMSRVLAGDRVITVFNKHGEITGKLFIENISQMQELDIVDYLRAGMQLCVTFAVDFGDNNGSPTIKSSLHYLHEDRSLNEYQQAILQVGQVLMQYNPGQVINLYGVGCKVDGTRHSMFPLGFGPQSQVQGVQAAVQAYSQAIQRGVACSMQNNYSPIILKIGGEASMATGNQPMRYNVLVIFCNDCMNDDSEVREAIVKNSGLPMSIIIIGVGESKFTKWYNLRVLDNDHGEMSTLGNTPLRDIVHFTVFNEVKNNPQGLAKAVFEELPGQINRYYCKLGLQPSN